MSDQSKTRDLASQAYVYGFPLVLMNVTRQQMNSPINEFHHLRTFPDDTFTDIVSPNVDTLYSSAWLDLSEEPMVLSVPDTNGRYYLMPMLDAWTNVFTSPGKRTTGTGKHDFAIVGPNWKGTLSPGVEKLQAPTDLVWILGRTQTNGKSDYKAVNDLQDQYRLTPLSVFSGGKATPGKPLQTLKIDPKIPPVQNTALLDGVSFFKSLAMFLKGNPPLAADGPMVETLKQLGIEPGKDFNPSAENIAAINEGAKAGYAAIVARAKQPFGTRINGWDTVNNSTEQLGNYGTKYLLRSFVSLIGLGANLTQDATYPRAMTDIDGQPFNGADKYVIHMDRDQVPPVNAFWSLTMYNEKQFLVKNPINRFAIGDRDKLKFNSDGSLDIYIQSEDPGADKSSNWLPAPSGRFNLFFRLYWPKEEVLSGKWKVPGLKNVGQKAQKKEVA